jgi:hypothetical protein
MTKKEFERSQYEEPHSGKIFLILIPVAMIGLAALAYWFIWFLISLI